MARLARVVIPDLPHHVTQRGNRRERVFFEDADYAAYLDLISVAARRAGTAIWSYCLMPNHVHFIMAPFDAGRSSGHLRRGAPPLHRPHPPALQVDRTPVAGPVRQRGDGRRSHAGGGALCADEPGARGHGGASGGMALVERAGAPGGPRRRDRKCRTLAAWIDDFAAFLGHPEDEIAMGAVLRSASTGRPAGAAEWLADLEKALDRRLAREKRGRKPKGVVTGENSDLFRTVSP